MILVTGASGFVGQTLVIDLCQRGYTVRAAVRSDESHDSLLQLKANLNLSQLTIIKVGEMDEHTDWSLALLGVDTVIHCAARAHILKDRNENPLALFRRINTKATIDLAHESSRLGVKRFIFLSSIQVLGNTSGALPLSEQSQPNPQSPYAQSKTEAEIELLALTTAMERVIIRPPLIYGPGVKGNLQKLIQLIKKGLPLPLGSVRNRRQLIGIHNLTDFIIHCVENPKAANQTFVVSDKEVLTTTDLIKAIAKGIGKKPRLIPIPHKLLHTIFRTLGRTRLSEQLLANLEIDFSKASALLDWQPPFTMEEQLKHHPERSPSK